MKPKYPQLTNRKCYKCGKNMLLMSVSTDKVPMQHNPVTTSVYKCSDLVCRDESEKDMERFAKRRKDQETAREERIQRVKDSKKENARSTAKK